MLKQENMFILSDLSLLQISLHTYIICVMNTMPMTSAIWSGSSYPLICSVLFSDSSKQTMEVLVRLHQSQADLGPNCLLHFAWGSFSRVVVIKHVWTIIFHILFRTWCLENYVKLTIKVLPSVNCLVNLSIGWAIVITCHMLALPYHFNPSLAEHDMPCLSKQCRSRSVGFWRSQLIWICTVCH